jgi:hypothetical protein
MNWFASFAVLLTITQALVPTTGKTPDNGTRNSHTQNRRADTSKNPSAALVSPQAKDSDSPALKPDTNKDAADLNQPAINITNPAPTPIVWRVREWAIWGANIALAIVGIGGIVVAIWTLCFIKRQAVEMCRQRITMEKTLNAIRQQANHMERQTGILEKSVVAAQASADAYVATERPFVMIECRGESFWAVNHGKSPAQIIFSNPVPFTIYPKFDELPESLNYGFGFDNPNSQQINVQWIPPKGEHDLGAFDPAIFNFMDKTLLAELSSSQRVLLIYSAFKYRGINGGKTYTSTYCYRRFDGGLRMWGGYGWNQYT